MPKLLQKLRRKEIRDAWESDFDGDWDWEASIVPKNFKLFACVWGQWAHRGPNPDSRPEPRGWRDGAG